MNTNPPRTWRRRLLRGVYYLAALITLLALAGTVAGWWARRHWREVKAELTASGRILPLEKLIPPPIPDEENFAAIPILRPQWEEIARKRSASDLGEISKFELLPEFDLKKPGQAGMSFPLGYNEWRTSALDGVLDGTRLGPALPGESAAAAVIRALGPLDDAMAAIATGARRPGCRFPIRYEDRLTATLPHVVGFRRIAQVFAIRAMARLEAQDAAGAAEDIVTILRLGAHLQRDPSMIQFFIGHAIQFWGTNLVWEGCVRRAWSAEHLAGFERELVGSDLFSTMRRVLQLEIVTSVAMFETSARDWWSLRDLFTTMRALGERTVGAFFGDYALYLGFVDLARTGSDLAEALPRARPARFDPTGFLKVLEGLESEQRSWTRWISAMAIPSYHRSLHRLVGSQARLELCLAAIRLERARLATGSYPSSLAEIDIPNDLNAGAPLRYEVAPDGSRFRLRGRGWDLKGVSEPTPSGQPWSWYSNVGGPAQWD